MRRIRRFPWVAALLLGLVAGAEAGGTKADYARAERLERAVRGSVRNPRLAEVWLDAQTLCYPWVDEDGRSRLRRVDLPDGRPRPAFDDAAVQSRLRSLLGLKDTDAPLAIDPAGVDGEELQAWVRGALVGIQMRTGVVRRLKLEDMPSLGLAPSFARRSSGGGRDTAITFVNRSTKPVRLVWLDHAGQPKPYGSVRPGTSFRQHTYPGHVWLVRAEDGTELGSYTGQRRPAVVFVTGTPPTRPERKQTRGSAWSPDGSRRAFIKNHDVHVRDTKTGEETRLSTDGSAKDTYRARFRWSPDGRYLMAIQEQPAQQRTVHVVNSVPKEQFQPALISYSYLKPGDRIARPRPRLFDITAGKAIPIAESLHDIPWSIRDLHWSKDGKRFRFLYNQRGHQVRRLVELDPAKGTARALIDETSTTFIDYSQKTWMHATSDGKAYLWMSERSGWNHLYRVDAKTGKTTPITDGTWVVRRVLDVDEAAGQIRFEAMGVFEDQDPYHVHIGRVGLDGQGLTWLTRGDGTHALRFSPDGAHYIDVYSRVDLPPVYELRRMKDGSLVCELGRADWAPLLETGWKPTERFHAKGRDGATDIWGIIHRPSTFDPAKRYPVIESIYAGPHGHHVPKRFRTWSGAKRMAELGFVVVQIDGMGTNWRSKAFHDVCWKNLGDSGFPDRVAWMQAAAKTRPWMDLERIGIYGGSAGGQSAMRALLAHGNVYDVAVADCGCHDNRMDKLWWNEAWMGWPIGPHYAEQSNITQAHRLEGKLLLIVGEIDRNVDPASTMKVVDALVKADKDFDLLVMPGRGHGAAGHPYARRRQADFFVRHLLGVEPRGE